MRHPELAAAKSNRDFVVKQVCEAVATISDVAQGRATGDNQRHFEGPGGSLEFFFCGKKKFFFR